MNYCKIENMSVSNGTGIRVVLWLSGCRLNCKNCHNPETHDFEYGQEFNKQAKEELFKLLDNPIIDGLTLTGGHPLEYENVLGLLALLPEIVKRYGNSKSIWCYTGYKWEDIINRNDFHALSIQHLLINYIDVLIDGKYEEDNRDLSLAFRGSTNQRLINSKESMKIDNLLKNKLILLDL